VRCGEAALERAVSRYIRAMPLLWLDVPDRDDRASVEAWLIGLLSNANRDPIDPASVDWLGRYAAHAAIARSGLWNVNDVDDHPDLASSGGSKRLQRRSEALLVRGRVRRASIGCR
jgi:hypothetical protein